MPLWFSFFSRPAPPSVSPSPSGRLPARLPLAVTPAFALTLMLFLPQALPAQTPAPAQAQDDPPVYVPPGVRGAAPGEGPMDAPGPYLPPKVTSADMPLGSLPLPGVSAAALRQAMLAKGWQAADPATLPVPVSKADAAGPLLWYLVIKPPVVPGKTPVSSHLTCHGVGDAAHLVNCLTLGPEDSYLVRRHHVCLLVQGLAHTGAEPDRATGWVQEQPVPGLALTAFGGVRFYFQAAPMTMTVRIGKD